MRNFGDPQLRSGTRAAMLGCLHPSGALTCLFPAQDFITGHQFEIARCSQCGFVVTSPQPTETEMALYYPEGYYGTPAERRFPWYVELLQRALYRHRAGRVIQALGSRTGKVLDVGCGRGLLLKEFRLRGWEVQGTELSEQASRYARDVVKVPVSIGNLEALNFPENHFDAVTLWHVLEHVPDPRTLLAEVNRILKPGGVLMVGVPNFGGFEARICRDKWFHLDVPRHITHLTRSLLERTLAERGFADFLWSGFAIEYDVFSFVQSALNRIGFRHNLLYNVLRGKQAKVMAGSSTSALQILGTFAFAVPLGFLSLPATTFVGFLCQGGTLTVLGFKSARSW